MRLGVVALVLVACGGHPPHNSDVRPPDDTVRPSDVTEAPPEFRILPLNPSGFMWPLTTPPSLEPHYRVGFTWPLVCGNQAVLPGDVGLYVDAWCRHLRSPQFDFVGALTRVLSSNVPGLRAAAILDLANNGAEDFGLNPWSGEVTVTRIAVQVALGDIIRGVSARLRWRPRLTADEYLEVAKLASSALLMYDAEGLAIRALQRTIRTSCKRLEEVREIAALIDGDHRKQGRFADARRELVTMTESGCLEYQAGHAGK